MGAVFWSVSLFFLQDNDNLTEMRDSQDNDNLTEMRDSQDNDNLTEMMAVSHFC
jgi:hypothetical protein